MYDLLIRNANIIDGTGAPAYRADVGVTGGRIAYIGHTPQGAKETVDADGLCLAPGFIDIHSHSDGSILTCPMAHSRILQGVTTEIAGNCGDSPMPARKGESGIGEFLGKLEAAGASVNLGMLVGHGTLRAAAMGEGSAKAGDADIAAMQALADDAMRAGAFGLSTGLIYPPGCYSDTDELAAVVSAIKPYGGYYATHMRNEGARVVQAVEEALEIARRAQVALQISHHKVTYKPDWQVGCYTTTAMIRRARRQGMDVTCDQYPYRASATGLSSNLPAWAFDGGNDALLARLADPETRSKLKEQCNASHIGRWGDIFVSYVTSEKNRWMPGHSVADIAAQLGKDPAETVFDILTDERCRVGEICYGMCEEDIEHIMREPYTMVGSDGEAMPLDYVGVPHPRNYGTFPRVIAHYSRARGLFPIETAISKMTSLPAARAGLNDRGAIKLGLIADLVLFDAAAIADTPTFEKPIAGCAGIERVYVNGVLTAQGGAHTGAKAGVVLRRK